MPYFKELMNLVDLDNSYNQVQLVMQFEMQLKRCILFLNVNDY